MNLDPKTIAMILAAVGGFLGAFALRFVASFAREQYRRVMTDSDPKNDAQGPLWKAIAEAASQKDVEAVKAHVAKLEKM